MESSKQNFASSGTMGPQQTSYSQPQVESGLEVHYVQDPIVASTQDSSQGKFGTYFDHYAEGGEAASPQRLAEYQAYTQTVDVEKQAAQRAAADAQRQSRRMRWIAIGVAILAVAVLGAVLGGVLGSRKSDDGQQASNGNGNSSGNGAAGGSGGTNTSSPATQIQAFSSLTATGYMYGTNYAMKLFFQSPDASLKYVEYDSVFGTWSAPQPAQGTFTPSTNAAMAVGTLLNGALDPNEPPFPQTEFFFNTQQNTLGAQNWRSGLPATGGQDSAVSQALSLAVGAQLAAYWPSVIFQDGQGRLHDFTYRPTPGWGATAMPVTGSPGSPLLILPREARGAGGEAVNSSSARVFYRASTGELSVFDRDANGVQQPTSGALPVTINATATLGGFATARAGTTDNVNVHLLYQNTDGAINHVFQTDDSTWQGPTTDPVFAGADKPTRIACVTAASMGIPNVPLTSTTDINRCFFQSGRAVKQVGFDGSAWKDLGFLPIP